MRPGRVLLVIGSIVTALSLAGLALAVWLVASSVAGGVGDVLRAPELTAPTHRTMTLEQGAYTVFEPAVGGQQGIVPEDLGVVTADGQAVPVAYRAGENITRGGRQYVSALGFTAPQAGRYEITVTGPPGAQVVIGRSVLEAFRDALPGVLVGVAGGLMLIVGVILLIVGLVRRSRARRPPPGPWTPPTQLGQWPQPGPWPPPQGQAQGQAQGQGQGQHPAGPARYGEPPA